MTHGNTNIDYAQAVLSKHPDAFADSTDDEQWVIRPRDESPCISAVFSDRDAAWRDAYERMKGKMDASNTR